MAFKLFQDENQAQGLTPSSTFRAGVSNFDRGSVFPEKGVLLPNMTDKAASWMGYQCILEVRLDAGLVLHKPLPQEVDSPSPGLGSGGLIADTLASSFISPMDGNVDTNTNGPNYISQGGYSDIVQKMATSDYRFILSGRALRFNYKIPIPGLKTVCGRTAYPDSFQRAATMILGNYCGVPLWYAEWELWYFIILPPTRNQDAPPQVAYHIAAETPVSPTQQVPYSIPDPNAVATAPFSTTLTAVIPR